MRVGRLVGSGGWKYAAGEVLLIVVGILIAIAVSDWQTRRADRQTELTILGELHTTLTADFELLESRLERLRRIETRVGVLLSHLQSGAPYSDSLDAYFGTVYGVTTTELNTAAYESLKSQGLGLISDEGLRSHVARVYEQSYRRVEWTGDLESDVVLGLLRPYFLLHFRDLRFSQSATPLDFQALLSDIEFLNLVAYRLQTVRQSHIPAFERAISEVGALIEEIAFELAG